MKYFIHEIMNPFEFLERKGIRKPFQPKKRINLTIENLIELLIEYAKIKKDENIKKT